MTFFTGRDYNKIPVLPELLDGEDEDDDGIDQIGTLPATFNDDSDHRAINWTTDCRMITSTEIPFEDKFSKSVISCMPMKQKSFLSMILLQHVSREKNLFHSSI